MWLLYRYSDILSFLMYHVISYRKKVVFDNLKNSFPEKSEKEIKKIARKFYRNLSDMILEGIKGFTISKKNVMKRNKVMEVELTKKLYDQNKNIIFAAGHAGNWEWGARTSPYQLYHKSIVLYKPLKNKKIDAYLRKLRTMDNLGLYPIKSTARAFLNNDKPFSVVMLGDQNPSNRGKAIWVKFLNQPTACLHGIEVYAKKFDIPVIFAEFRRVKRGYYETYFEIITENPRELEDGQITKIFMNKLEEKIIKQPEIWLWSHKRWKHKFNPEKETIIE